MINANNRVHAFIFFIGTITSVIIPIVLDFYNNHIPILFICFSMIIDYIDFNASSDASKYIKACVLSIVAAIYILIYWGQIYNIVVGTPSSVYIILSLCYIYTILFISIICQKIENRPMILTSSLFFVAFMSDFVGQVFRNFIDEPSSGFKILISLFNTLIILAQVCGVILVVLIYVVMRVRYSYYTPSIHTPFPLYIPIVCIGLIFDGFGMTPKSVPYITYLSSIFYSTNYFIYCFERMRLQSLINTVKNVHSSDNSPNSEMKSNTDNKSLDEESYLLSSTSRSDDKVVITTSISQPQERSIFLDSSSEEDDKNNQNKLFEL